MDGPISRKHKVLILFMEVAALVLLGLLYVMSWDGWTFSFDRCLPTKGPGFANGRP
jgi:hypothetical protein